MSEVTCPNCDEECEEFQYVIGDTVTGNGYVCPKCDWQCDGDIDNEY